MKNTIHHRGVIEKIADHSIYVKIVQQSACAGCHAKSMCMAADSKEKIVEIPDSSGLYHVDDAVLVCGQSSMGMQAVLLAFVLPLLLVVIAIIFGTYNRWSEGISALAGLLILLPYYGVLYLLRDKLKKRFIFTLKKTEN
ncbi:MAG: SoxR reducing system RseC family protein [Tannerellaceae bacterium]|jgi:sigma-E factor negative regulatory protein RseC|nr:SoxR reducing system RseC family protein [Tannerellaceae bacterium]